MQFPANSAVEIFREFLRVRKRRIGEIGLGLRLDKREPLGFQKRRFDLAGAYLFRKPDGLLFGRDFLKFFSWRHGRTSICGLAGVVATRAWNFVIE
jgi:hypothetical protein